MSFIENHIQESVESRSAFDRLRDSRIVQSVAVIGMVASLSACDEAFQAQACERLERGIVMEEMAHIGEENLECSIDGVEITSENLELHSAIAGPSTEKKQPLFGSAETESSPAQEASVPNDPCGDLDRKTPPAWLETESTENSIISIGNDFGVSCDIVDGQIVEIGRTTVAPASESSQPEAENEIPEAESETVPPPPSPFSINLAVFEGDYDGLNESQKKSAGAFTALMRVLEVESHQELDELIGGSGWSVLSLPEREGFYGLTFPQDRRIELYPHSDHSEDYIMRYLAHELGHAIDVGRMDDESRQYFAHISEQLPDTQYWPDSYAADFQTGAGDFAEAFAVWVMSLKGVEVDDRSEVSPKGNTLAVKIFFGDLVFDS